MSWTGYRYEGAFHPFRRGTRAGRSMGRLLRGVGRGMRRRPVPRPRRGCCCCPLVLMLGLAGLGSIGGLFYLGARLLGWA